MLEERRGIAILDAFWLKIIMVVLMTLDHLYINLFPDTLYWGHIAARVVAPVFCYLVTDGMVHTSDRKKYILRILAFGLAMMLGNSILYAIFGRWIDNSILMSLAIGAAVIACIDNARDAEGGKKALWIAAVAGLFAVSFLFEGQYMMPLMAVIFYFLRLRPVIMWIVYFVVFCVPYLFVYPASVYLDEPLWAIQNLPSQFWMILAVIPILLYNGQRGFGGKVSKYFFYVYYPLHIWIIYLFEQYFIYGF